MSVQDTVLSIVLTSRNQLGALKFSILSLLDQQPDVFFEIIVVDCGSTDGSDQFLTEQAEKGALRAIFADRYKGRTAARNLAADAAFGRHMVFFDPGVLVAPNWWKSLVRSLDKDPRLAAVAGRLLLPDGNIDHAGLALLHWPATESSRPKLSSRSVHAGRPGNYEGANRPMTMQAVAGEAIMVRATSFFAVGGFSARVGREHHQQRPDYMGDPAGLDLCLRLGTRGWSCAYQSESIMTRLRLARDNAVHRFENYDRDMAIVERTWLDRVKPDFLVNARGGSSPVENGPIKPYIEPAITFQNANIRGLTNPAGEINKPAASVIINTQDDLEATQVCVSALLNNTDPCHELLFVDSGSDLQMNEYLTKLSIENDHCHLILGGDETSDSELVNRALNMSEGRHLVLLDRRTVVTRGWLETLIGTAEMNPRAGLVGPVTNRMNGMQQIPAVNYDVKTRDGLKGFAFKELMAHASEHIRTMRLGGFCLLIKRELLARIGGLDHRFDGGFYEFNDYSMRAHMAGYECLIARGCYVHHQTNKPGSTNMEERLLQLEIQWEVFKRKWDIPHSVNLNSQLDLSTLLVGGFDRNKHFQALSMEPTIEDTKQPNNQPARTVAAGT